MRSFYFSFLFVFLLAYSGLGHGHGPGGHSNESEEQVTSTPHSEPNTIKVETPDAAMSTTNKLKKTEESTTPVESEASQLLNSNLKLQIPAPSLSSAASEEQVISPPPSEPKVIRVTAPDKATPATNNLIKIEESAAPPESEGQLLNSNLTIQTPAPSLSSAASEDNLQESNPRNYDPSSCAWVEDMPRRLAHGPSCGRTPTKICTGYVACNLRQGEGRFIRMSTCSANLCGADDAIACTRDRSYFSSRPKNETKSFMSKGVRDFINNGSKARPQ